MKKPITSILVAFGFFLSTFVTSSAMAGSYAIGIIAATGKVDTRGSETEGRADAATGLKEKTTTSISEGLLYGSLFAEYTFGEMYGLTLGASYTPMDSSIGTKTRTDSNSRAGFETGDDTGTYRAKAEISNHATIYLEPTFMPSDNFGLYLKGGVARVTVRSLANIAFGEDSSVYGDETVYGGMYGLGAKVVHDSGLLFKLEYIKIDYNTVKMKSSSGNSNSIYAEPEIDAVRIAIGYKF